MDAGSKNQTGQRSGKVGRQVKRLHTRSRPQSTLGQLQEMIIIRSANSTPWCHLPQESVLTALPSSSIEPASLISRPQPQNPQHQLRSRPRTTPFFPEFSTRPNPLSTAAMFDTARRIERRACSCTKCHREWPDKSLGSTGRLAERLETAGRGSYAHTNLMAQSLSIRMLIKVGAMLRQDCTRTFQAHLCVTNSAATHLEGGSKPIPIQKDSANFGVQWTRSRNLQGPKAFRLQPFQAAAKVDRTL